MEMEGKVALITGASGGIGAAVARRLHATGASVGLLSRSGDDLGLDRGLGVVCDVRHSDAVGAATFCPEHGDLAFAQEVLCRRLHAVIDDNADRGGEHDLLAADLHRRAQCAAHALGKRGDLARVWVRDHENGELVAAEPRQRVLRIQMAR